MITNYEVMYIIDAQSQNLKNLQEKMHAILGKEIKVDDWGLKTLAYPISKKIKGHYTVIKVKATPEVINEFGRIARIEKDILRYLTINIDSEKNYNEKITILPREAYDNSANKDEKDHNTNFKNSAIKKTMKVYDKLDRPYKKPEISSTKPGGSK